MAEILEIYAVARAKADPSRSLDELLPGGVDLFTCRGEARFYHAPGRREREAIATAWRALLAARKARAASRARRAGRMATTGPGDAA